MYSRRVKSGASLFVGNGVGRIVIKNLGDGTMKVGIDADKSIPIRTEENPDERRNVCETKPLNRFIKHDEPIRAA